MRITNGGYVLEENKNSSSKTIIQVIVSGGQVNISTDNGTVNANAIVQNGKLKHLTFYDEIHSQVVSIDLMHQHHGLYLLRHNNHSGDY